MSRLERRFGTRVALAGIDLRVRAGETVVLVGPNGSGKTTLLNVVAGLRPPTSGSVRVGGAPPGSRAARRQVALVPDQPAGFEELTVTEQARLLVALAGSESRADETALAELELEPLADARLGTLSRGQRRRAALAAALAAAPRLLLVDEATATLDRGAVALLVGLLRRRARAGGAALLATHDLAFAQAVADRAVLLDDGRIVADGPVSTLSVLTRLRTHEPGSPLPCGLVSHAAR
ncbi:MAG: ATP-binding cassette domain-containing protein [Gaiella sp.]